MNKLKYPLIFNDWLKLKKTKIALEKIKRDLLETNQLEINF